MFDGLEEPTPSFGLVVLSDRLLATGLDSATWSTAVFDFARDSVTGALTSQRIFDTRTLSTIAPDTVFDIGTGASLDATEEFAFVPVEADDGIGHMPAPCDGDRDRSGIATLALKEREAVPRSLSHRVGRTLGVRVCADGGMLYGFGEAENPSYSQLTAYRIETEGTLTVLGSIVSTSSIRSYAATKHDGRAVVLYEDRGRRFSIGIVDIDPGTGKLGSMRRTDLPEDFRTPRAMPDPMVSPGGDLVTLLRRSGDQDSVAFSHHALDASGKATAIDTPADAVPVPRGFDRRIDQMVGSNGGHRVFSNGAAVDPALPEGKRGTDRARHLLHSYERRVDGTLDWTNTTHGASEGIDADDLYDVHDLAVSPDDRFLYAVNSSRTDLRGPPSIARISWFATAPP